MIQEIHQYLQQANPDFNAGYGLFCKYSPNRILIESIGRRHDMDMLLYELKKISDSGFVAFNSDADVMQIQSTAVQPQNFRTTSQFAAVHRSSPKDHDTEDVELRKAVSFRTYDDRRTRRSDLPPEMQIEFDANAADYSVRRALHEKMKMATTDSDRAQLRARILETQERIMQRWKKIDDFQAKAAEETQATAFNEKSARAYISKALKEKNISDKKVAGVKARVKALLEHGCNISDETIRTLKARHLI